MAGREIQLQEEVSLLDQVRAAVIATDRDGTIVRSNPYVHDLYGWMPDEVLGRDVLELLVDPEDRARAAQIVAQVLEGRPWEGDFPMRRKDGSPVLARVTLSPVFDGSPDPVGLVGVSIDVTQRIRDERHLAAQYAVTQALANAEGIEDASAALLPELCEALGWKLGALWMLDPNGDALRSLHVAGAGAEAFAEATRELCIEPGEGLPGRVWRSGEPAWIADVTEDENFIRMAAARETGLRAGFAFPIRRGLEVLGVIEFFTDEVAEPDQALLRVMDAIGSQVGQFIERKRAESAVRDSEARKSAILEAALDAVITMDHSGNVVEMNPAAEEIFGYRRDDVVGREMADLIIPPHLREQHREGLARYLETGSGPVIGNRLELTGMRADGREFPVELTVTRVDIEDPPLFTGYIRDITQRRQAERELKARERQQAAVAELGRLALVADDPEPLMHHAVRLVAEALDVELVGLLELLPDREELLLRVGVGWQDGAVGTATVATGTRSQAGFTIDANEPVIVEDLRTETRFTPSALLLEHEVLSGVSVIVRTDGRPYGVLEAVTRHQRRFSGDDALFMRSVANVVGATITRRRTEEERARLLEAEQAARAQAERARERLAFLAEASEVIGASLDYGETLTKVARLVVPRLADWCSVYILGQNGDIQPLVVAHADPAKVEWARSLIERYPTDPRSPTGVPNVIRTGQPELYPEIPEELLQQTARDEEHLRLLREVQLRSVMIVPLVGHGKPLGAITFVATDSGIRYGAEDLELAQELARRAASAIENARLYQERSHVARVLQSSLLPPSLPTIPRVDVAAVYRPAGEGTEIGGDFYDLFQCSEDTWAVVVGDVCGKGAEAAAVIGLARFTVRAVAMQENRPSSILGRLNDALLQQQREDARYCTVEYLRLHPTPDGARVTVSCGGHPLPLVLRADGTVHEVGRPGTLLGVFADPELHDATVDLGRGDAMLLYTDGVTEEQVGDEFFGEERLAAVLRAGAGGTARDIAERIQTAVVEFSPEPPRDDMAVLVIRIPA